MKNCLFIGSIFSESDLEYIQDNSKGDVTFSSHILQTSLIDGFKLNDVSLKVLSTYLVGNFPFLYKKIFVKGNFNNKLIKSIAYLNVQPFKDFIISSKVKNEIKKWVKENDNNNTIFIYDIYPPFLKSIQKLHSNVIVNIIVPDIPLMNNFVDDNGIISYLKEIRFKNVNKYLKRVDNYVLLSEHMTEFFTDSKNSIIIEGMVSENLINSFLTQTKKNYNKRVITYTGSLHKEYGILDLLESFIKLDSSMYELRIYGSGNQKEVVEKFSTSTENIKFFGLVNPKEIPNILINSDLLVNPRSGTESFTKYSFPSKLMEYMLSGVPILCYKLSGVSKEYDEILNYIPSNIVSFEKEIENIFNNQEKYNKRAIYGKEYVSTYKSNKTQVCNILDYVLTTGE